MSASSRRADIGSPSFGALAANGSFVRRADIDHPRCGAVAANGRSEPFQDLGNLSSGLQPDETTIVFCGCKGLPMISRNRPFASEIPKRACQGRQCEQRDNSLRHSQRQLSAHCNCSEKQDGRKWPFSTLALKKSDLRTNGNIFPVQAPAA
jgi:hypothetical protein